MGKGARRFNLLSAAIVLTAVLTGCSDNGSGNGADSFSGNGTSKGNAAEAQAGNGSGSGAAPLTLDLYSDRAWYSDWTGPEAKRISEKTGISFNVKKPVQDDSDGKDISLMIASNSLPDVIVVDAGNKMLKQLVDGHYLYSMDELIDKYAPELRTTLNEQFGPELLTNFKEKDGKTYELVSGYPTAKYLEEAKKNSGLAPVWLPQLVVRKDYYDEIGRPDTTTPQGFLSALEQMAKNHPDKIPYLGDKGQHNGDLSWFSSQFGIAPYFADGTEVKHTIHDPNWKNMIKFGYTMASKGLLTKESFVNTGDVTAQKVAAGDAIVSALNSAAENSTPPKDNPNTKFEMLQPFSTYSYSSIPKGWMALAIPKTNKNPERTMKLLAYTASKEGQADFSFGVEGKGPDDFMSVNDGPHFYYDSSIKSDYYPQGKPSYTTSFQAALNKDWGGTWKQAGFGEPIVLLSNWAVSNAVAWNPKDEKKVAYDKLMAPKMKYYPEFNFTIDSAGELGVIEAKVKSLQQEYLPKLVFASSDAEFESTFNAMLKVADQLGIAKLEAEYTKQYAELKQKLGNSQ
ncbi:extracellular solute-binding protein [Paenibacillus sp. R14(2021)]|uniref:extracellular solute-binding protein n=1 Tax=Paenibacillus sp. R14(2021) TaxID=2859228 RepID=UPI001C613556|nr:extracellular solute-binding protein [Paenibacillus sp. R14(2021)]